MATTYVRSTDGDNADNGSTWALANATLVGAMADTSAGDRVFVSDNHAESTAGAVTITSPGTPATPCYILCGDDAAEPPTALSAAGTVTTTGGNNITVNGSAYVYGLIFSPGSPSANAVFQCLQDLTAHVQVYEQCQFRLSSSTGARLHCGANGGMYQGSLVMKDCILKFGNAAQFIQLYGIINIHWAGGSVDAAGSVPTVLASYVSTSRSGNILFENLDLSKCTGALVDPTWMGPGQSFTVRNCKLGAGVAIVTGSFAGPGRKVRVHNCDSGDTNYRLAEHSYEGIVTQETTLVKTSGATDGTTPISWKLVSSANAEYPIMALSTPEILIWNDTTGSSKTITVDILTDSATNLTDAEVWLEVEYLGTSGFPIGTHITDAKASILASAADQTTSSATWTTTGMSNPNKQKLSVTFTPAEKGPFIAKVMLAKASTTIYVDPVLQVT